MLDDAKPLDLPRAAARGSARDDRREGLALIPLLLCSAAGGIGGIALISARWLS
jgi:hypothetical protein